VGDDDAVTARSPLQTLALLVAVTFLLLGVLAFVPGITTDAKLLGVFEVSILHNIVHLLSGIAGLVLARTWSGARTYLVGGGVVYLGLWILGLVNGANWLPANNPDDWLHFGLGVGMIGLAFATPARYAPHQNDAAITT
jgi:hypothetical protein